MTLSERLPVSKDTATDRDTLNLRARLGRSGAVGVRPLFALNLTSYLRGLGNVETFAKALRKWALGELPKT